MVKTAIHDLSNDNVRNNPLWAIHQSKEALFIAQYLISEFEYSVSCDIEAHPLYEREGNAWFKLSKMAQTGGFYRLFCLSSTIVLATH